MPTINDYYLPTKMGGPIGTTGPVGVIGPIGVVGPTGVTGPKGKPGVPGISEQELREIKRQKLIKERNEKIQKINDKYV
jgi:hypothetical protein